MRRAHVAALDDLSRLLILVLQPLAYSYLYLIASADPQPIAKLGHNVDLITQ